jgi:hypothetical protein
MNPTPRHSPLGARLAAIARAAGSLILAAIRQPGPVYCVGFWPGWMLCVTDQSLFSREMHPDDCSRDANPD